MAGQSAGSSAIGQALDLYKSFWEPTNVNFELPDFKKGMGGFGGFREGQQPDPLAGMAGSAIMRAFQRPSNLPLPIADTSKVPLPDVAPPSSKLPNITQAFMGPGIGPDPAELERMRKNTANGILERY